MKTATGKMRDPRRTSGVDAVGASRLTIDVLSEALARLHEVPLIHDVVALEDAAGGVAQQHHRDALGYTGAHQVPRRGPSTIVDPSSDQPGVAARVTPGVHKGAGDAVALERPNSHPAHAWSTVAQRPHATAARSAGRDPGEFWIGPDVVESHPRASTSSQVSSVISRCRQPE